MKVVYPWERPNIIRKHVVTGAMGSVSLTLLSGMYLVAFGNNIGMQYWQWGLLSCAASLVNISQLVSAYLVRRSGVRRSLWFSSALAALLLRAAAVLGAFVLFNASGRASCALFILLLAVANFFSAIALPPWLSWLAEIIPKEEHGQFLGLRSAWIALVNVCIIVPIGYAMDRFGGNGATSALMLVFAFGFLLGILDLLIHRTIPEPRMSQRQRRTSFWGELKAPLSDANFRPWLIFNAFWTFGMTLGGSLATIYFVENLGIRRNFLGGSFALELVPLAAVFLTGRWAGTMVDRYGVKPVLRWGHAIWALLPLFWLIATPSSALIWLGLGSLVAGAASSAASNASNKLIIRIREPASVPMYVAVSACTGSLAAGIAPLIAGFFLQFLKDFSWTIGTFTVVGFHILFIASFVLRSLATFMIRQIPEPPD